MSRFGDNPAGRRGGEDSASQPPVRRVLDLLPGTFPLDAYESEWLLTLLSAAELRYIFEDNVDGAAQD